MGYEGVGDKLKVIILTLIVAIALVLIISSITKCTTEINKQDNEKYLKMTDFDRCMVNCKQSFQYDSLIANCIADCRMKFEGTQ
jgi:hypothetical protein